MYRIPEDLKSKYEFVTLAAKRAEQLQMGALPRVDARSGKVTVIAQEEVARGRVTPFDPEQQPLAEALETEEEE
jgi:DNA-directed RNA polymerase omega subunit